MKCPNCGAALKFNEAKSTYVCDYCGFTESIVEKVVEKEADIASCYNLLISYPETEKTDEKIFYRIADANLSGYIEEGQSKVFVLAPGPHQVFLQIGNHADNYTVVIVQSEPVRIIYSQGTQFLIQQPDAGYDYADLENGKHVNAPTKLAFFSLILTLSVFAAPIGFILSIVDMTNSTKKGKKASVVSIVSLVMGIALTPLSLVILIGSLLSNL